MLYQQQLIQQIFASRHDEIANKQADSQLDHPAFTVYHNNYIENGIRALSIGFPTVAGIMQERDFRRLAHDYLLARPKECFDWADYGADFADYMFNIEALSELPFLPELAELDWRLMHIERQADLAFDGASFGLLQTQDPKQLKFKAAPGLQLMRAIFPIKELYDLVHKDSLNKNSAESQALRQQHLLDTNKLTNIAIKLGVHTSIVLYREDYKARFEYTHGAAIKAFESMLADNNIATVLAHFKDDQAAMTTWLQQHIQTKKIYAIEIY